MGTVAQRAAKDNEPWFKELAAALESRTKQLFETGSTTTDLFGHRVNTIDLEHVLHAREEAIGDSTSLVKELIQLAQARNDIQAEVQLIRSLGVLPRLRKAPVAVEALRLWKERNEPEIIDALAEVVAEMLCAFPKFIGDWLESVRNTQLECEAQKQLLHTAPEQLLFRYGSYNLHRLVCNNDVCEDLAPEAQRIFREAQSLDEACKIAGELLFDLRRTPFRRDTYWH